MELAPRLVLYCFVFCLLICSSQEKRFEPTWQSLDTHVAPAWYDEAKLGIFMHWGLYSVPSFGTAWFWERWKSKNIFYLLFFFHIRQQSPEVFCKKRCSFTKFTGKRQCQSLFLIKLGEACNLLKKRLWHRFFL